MNGKKDQKAGEYEDTPSILATFLHALNVVFFKEKSFIAVFVDNRITLNLVSIFICMFAIPIKNPVSGTVVYDIGHIVESIMLTFIFICFLYLSVLPRKVKFVPFLRVFMALECVDLFYALTLFMEGDMLTFAVAGFMGWYLALSVVAVSRLGHLPYYRATFVVLGAFVFINMLPALFAM